MAAVSAAAAAIESLINGTLIPLTQVPRIIGAPPGIYTLWYRGRLVAFGLSDTAPGEGKPTNLRQAAGVTGRLRRLLSQPPVAAQEGIRRLFPGDMAAIGGETDQKRASNLLRVAGSCRWVETDTGPQAQALYAAIADELTLKLMTDQTGG